MSTKHTPGPWTVADEAGDLVLTVRGINDEFIADLSIANAHLIAAAPDLLAALLDIVAIDDGDISALWPYCDLFDNARAAIAKATGEAA